MSAVISVALYAFGTLRIPRKRICLESLSGRLSSFDMNALANCSATGIARLVEMELPELQIDDWVVEAQADSGFVPPESPKLAVL
jgi:hypothetical protein